MNDSVNVSDEKVALGRYAIAVGCITACIAICCGICAVKLPADAFERVAIHAIDAIPHK